MIRPALLLSALLLAYGALISPFSRHMQQRPFVEKLGYVPETVVLRIAAADQKPLAAAVLVFRTMMYYGGVPTSSKEPAVAPPDFAGMERTLVAATRLDPYNMDAYYFGQATLVWDLKHYSEANALLDYGMRYRSWDFYLPFFAGFNAAYFMNDLESAARYYRRVAELTGDDYFMKLAGRYLYETGETEQAIAYLTMMVQSARNDAVRAGLAARLEAFQGVRTIELARDRYQQATGKLPSNIDVLRREGFLPTLPGDPYGGTFYLAADGQVRSTSQFIPKVEKKDKKQ